MKKIISIPLNIIFIVSFLLMLVIFHPFLVLTRFLGGKRALTFLMTILVWIEVKLLLIRGIYYRYHNFKKLPDDKPIIFVGNHQSMWDIPPVMLKYYKHQPKFIAKKELKAFIPSVSFYLNYGGAVMIDRSDKVKSLEQIKDFANRIVNDGESVSIYPEGTRSKDGKVNYFKSAGLVMLLKELPDALIVPIAVKNSRKIDKGKIGVAVDVYRLNPRTIDIDNIDNELRDIRLEIMKLVE